MHFIQSKSQQQGSCVARIRLPDGHERTKMFSVKKYGEVLAFELTRRGALPRRAGWNSRRLAHRGRKWDTGKRKRESTRDGASPRKGCSF